MNRIKIFVVMLGLCLVALLVTVTPLLAQAIDGVVYLPVVMKREAQPTLTLTLVTPTATGTLSTPTVTVTGTLPSPTTSHTPTHTPTSCPLCTNTPTFTPTITPPTDTPVPTPTYTITRTPTRTPTTCSLCTDTPTPTPSGVLIIDHNNTNIDLVPDEWLTAARQYLFHYAHTSHGSQIMSGLYPLFEQDERYAYCTLNATSGQPPSDLPVACSTPDQLRFYDGQPGYDDQPYDDYITPELYWETLDGITRTMIVANTGIYDFSMWSWCGQASYYSTEQIQTYLDTMAGFEAEYPGMRFILMTGHTDGGSETLAFNNAMIRQYALDHDMVLFDFADIERYAPDGSGPYENDGDGYCEWCDAWCTAHPGDCENLPSDCAHTHPLFCKLKAQAFWWMLARLAGWEGVK